MNAVTCRIRWSSRTARRRQGQQLIQEEGNPGLKLRVPPHRRRLLGLQFSPSTSAERDGSVMEKNGVKLLITR
jgi:hypothetical protein